MRRLFPLLLCLALPVRGLAEPTPILLALRQGAWSVAQALAAANPDPVAAKLVTFIRLLNSGTAAAAEVLRFMAETPAWPDRDRLEQRYGEALADEPDERQAAALCVAHPPGGALAQLHCAEAAALGGDMRLAVRTARLAWIGLPASQALEADTLARWGRAITAADDLQRFDRLVVADPKGAIRQLDRLSDSDRRVGAARLAFRRRDPDALSFLAGVPENRRADPSVLLDEASWLRRSGLDGAALALWRTALPAAEAVAPPDRRAAFWTERDALARDVLASGDANGAYVLADDAGLPPSSAVDAEFLAGWIALRRLHDPARARTHFQSLAAASHAVITQSRAFYWLARAQPDTDAARISLARAAAFPTTFYGQAAARAAGQTDTAIRARVSALGDPATTQDAADALAGTELARAATILVAWADPRRAADFLRRLAQPPASIADRVLVARLALRLGLPDVAVGVARLVGRDGAVLAATGWPVPVQPPPGPVPAAFTLGIVRQESSFDPLAASAADAHGLMQIRPGTAAQMARALHEPAGPLTDPAINLRLGTAYLGTLLAQFGDSQAYAAAAYDAGPRHVHDWIAASGDAAATGDADALIDWIELIPFAETRNYVQRVLENTEIYRARMQGAG